jgi:hypothetical protein
VAAMSFTRGKNHLVGLLFSFCQIQNSKLLEMSYFFISYIILEVGKSQDLQVKNSKLDLLL